MDCILNESFQPARPGSSPRTGGKTEAWMSYGRHEGWRNVRRGSAHMDLSQRALSSSEEGKITSKDNYRNIYSLYSKTFFSTAQQNIPSCPASPWAQNLSCYLSCNFPVLKLSPKLCLNQKNPKKTNTQRLVIFFYTNSSFSTKKPNSGHSGWKQRRGE